MASTFGTRFLHNVHDIPLSALDGPPPTRAMPIHQGLGRDSWDRSNIWQTTSKRLEDLSGDDKQNVFPIRNNRMAMTDMSKTVAGASTDGSHNIMSDSSQGLHIAPASATLYPRSKGSLLSPTRLRNNGILGTDTGTTMTSLGQSSLLSGSAPDIESSISSPSTVAFKSQRGSTIGRSFRRFNVEDAEEFVPSYLRGNGRSSNRPSQFGSNGMFDYHDDLNGSMMNGSNHNHSISPAKTWNQPSSDCFPSRTTSNTRVAFVHGRNDNRGMHSLTSNPTGVVPSTFTAAQPHNGNAGVHFTNSFRHDRGIESGCRSSNLRPDVASYQPTTSNIFEMQPDRSDIRKYSYGTLAASQTESGDSYAIPTNQYAAWANSNAFNANPSNGSNTMYGTYGDSPAQQVPPSNLSRATAGDARNRSLTYRNNGGPVLPDSKVKFPGETGVPTYGLPSAPNQYHTPQYGYTHGAPRLTAYQQPYSNGADANVLGYYAEPTQQSEYDPAAADVSEVLAEFRAYHKSRKYELKDIYGHIVEFSGDQNGSRFIQTKIELANSDEKEQIFAELQTNARQLMADVFGNYVIQKMFDYGNQSQKKALASHMQGYMFALSTQAYGCRCIQKAFEHILTDQQAVLIKELEGRAMEVVESQHGNHVIQKAIECIPGEHIQFIVDAHRNQVVRLAKHIYGCRIIQRMLEYCGPQVKHSVLSELHGAITSLIDDQYGNYVIQCIIKKCGPTDRYQVIEQVKEQVFYYSTHKFASNVVEKAIAYADDNQLIEMVHRLTGSPYDNGLQSQIAALLKDQYGNYVMQTVLKTIPGPHKRELAQRIRLHLNCIGRSSRSSKQTTAMVDLVDAVLAENSPSSTCTGPQTPRTPTSLNSAGSIGTPLTKAIEMVPSGYPIRESQRETIALRPIHS